jgi:uncharacterized membrane protein YfcA
MTERAVLLAILVLLNVIFGMALFRARARYRGASGPATSDIAIGFVVSFFDTLGIGSYAPSTAIFKLRGRPADELIPGTLNIGLNVSALTETLIFVTAVLVDPVLLLTMVASASVGAWFGAGVVSRLPRRAIQLWMGCALLIAGTVFAATNLGLLPSGGFAMALTGWRFAVAVAVNFVLGGLMSVGIGSYAPSMILLALLGLNPLGAFPIMMATCGVVQPLAGLRFVKSSRFDWGVCLGMTCGGVFGVLLAAYVVKSLPLVALRWLVVGVVVYAAASMLRSAKTGKRLFFENKNQKTFANLG